MVFLVVLIRSTWQIKYKITLLVILTIGRISKDGVFSCFNTFNMTVKALNNLTCNSDDRKNLNIGFMLYSCFTFNKICMLILLSWRQEGSQMRLMFSCFWSCYLCSDMARVFEESFKVMAVELSCIKDLYLHHH